MKVIRMILVCLTAVATVSASSCTRLELREGILSEEKVLHATFEEPGAPTKTYLDSERKLLWTADDRLSVFEGNTYNQQYRYSGESGMASADFEKVSTGIHSGNNISTIYAVYPYQANNEISNDETISVNLPDVQRHTYGSFGLGANTMIAVTNGTNDTYLSFKNLCGYIVVKLYGKSIVKNISLKSNNGELYPVRQK